MHLLLAAIWLPTTLILEFWVLSRLGHLICLLVKCIWIRILIWEQSLIYIDSLKLSNSLLRTGLVFLTKIELAFVCVFQISFRFLPTSITMIYGAYWWNTMSLRWLNITFRLTDNCPVTSSSWTSSDSSRIRSWSINRNALIHCSRSVSNHCAYASSHVPVLRRSIEYTTSS